jgi:hypothetical protein
MRRSLQRFCLLKKMPKLEKKSEIIKEPSWSVITTTTESVFTINLMEPEIPFSQWTNAAMLNQKKVAIASCASRATLLLLDYEEPVRAE